MAGVTTLDYAISHYAMPLRHILRWLLLSHYDITRAVVTYYATLMHY